MEGRLQGFGKAGESNTDKGIKRQYMGLQSHFSLGKALLFEGSMFAVVVNGKVGQETDA